MQDRKNEQPVLVHGQRWKLIIGGIIGIVAAAGFLTRDSIAVMLHIPGIYVQFGAMSLTLVGLGWIVYSVKCNVCGLHLVTYSMANNGVGQWLHWLLDVKRCPKCGADHTGRHI